MLIKLLVKLENVIDAVKSAYETTKDQNYVFTMAYIQHRLNFHLLKPNKSFFSIAQRLNSGIYKFSFSKRVGSDPSIYNSNCEIE